MDEQHCTNPPAYRFTWPGKDEACICEEHVKKLRGVVEILDLHLQIIPLKADELEGKTCNQIVRTK